MMKLYTELASVYHGMYQSLFDYEKEFHFYEQLLRKYGSTSILEIGCGTGNLAPYFLNAGYDYVGLDIAEEMLNIARETNPAATFIQGDLRDIHTERRFDAALITGRSFTYMTTNQDVLNAFRSVHHTLQQQGILIFDNFKAESIILNFQPEHTHTAEYEGRKYTRRSHNSLNLQTGWTWDWNAEYLIEEDGKPLQIMEDHSLLRAFTEQELKIFLALSHFNVLDVIEEETFSINIIAQKVEL